MNSTIKFIGAVVAMLILNSCGPSRYMSKEESSFGNYGYEDFALDSMTYQVSFIGTGGQEQSTVERYTLFRAAELTKEKGFDHFVVLETTGDSKSSEVNFSGDDFMKMKRHSYTVVKTIRLGKGPRPGDKTSYDAAPLIATMGPKIPR